MYTYRLFVLLAAILLSLPASAQLYRWTDEDGSVHFSDRKPPSTEQQAKAEEVKVGPINIDDSHNSRSELRRIFPRQETKPKQINNPGVTAGQTSGAAERKRCIEAYKYVTSWDLNQSAPGEDADDRRSQTWYDKQRSRQKAKEMRAYLDNHCNMDYH